MISEPTLPTAVDALAQSLEAKEAKGLSRDQIAKDIQAAIARGDTQLEYMDSDSVGELARKSLRELGYSVTNKPNPFYIENIAGFKTVRNMVVIDWSGQVPEPLAPPKNR